MSRVIDSASSGPVPGTIVTATLQDASGALASGACIAVVAVLLGWGAVRLTRGGRWFWPLVVGMSAVGVACLAILVLLFGAAIAGCAPDAYECPL